MENCKFNLKFQMFSVQRQVSDEENERLLTSGENSFFVENV